ncbi:MAG: replicative DNA helicase [Oligoflexia bacterium]|nr:replicative DNA helicase [Oligoflexia bacterium]
MVATQELPHDLLAEKSLLGCLLIDSNAHDEINDLNLKTDDFFHPQYKVVFDSIMDLIHLSMPVDYVTLCTRLSDKGKLETLGEEELKGQAFILNIHEEQASSANIYYYAKTVKEKAILRNIIKVSQKIVQESYSFSGDTKDFLSKVESNFFKITQEIKTGSMKKLSACLIDNLTDLENNDRKLGELVGLSTGFDHLDAKLLGLQAGQLIIVAARPGMGKTSLALNIAMNSIEHSKLPVAIFSLEMLASELSLRILSSYAKIDSKKLRTKNLYDNELKQLGATVQTLANYPIYINDDGGTTIFDIQSECRKIKAEHGLGIVIVDYVQLMKPHSATTFREQQIAEISRGLKVLSKELECPVMALSQLNRGVESRTDKRPTLSDLRESGALEQDADVVLLVYRDDCYYPDSSREKGIAEIIIGKNRSGEAGVVKLGWKGSYTSFVNLAPQEYDELTNNNSSSSHSSSNSNHQSAINYNNDYYRT